MNKKLVWLIISCLMVTALILASCAPAVVEEKKATVVTKEPEKKAEKVEEVEEVVGPQYGGTLTVQRKIGEKGERTITSWDPLTGGTTNVCEVYLETLFNLDVSRGQTGTGEFNFQSSFIDPDSRTGILAESWEITNDPLRLIFHIKPGIYFQAVPGIMDRRELTADDVVYSFLLKRSCLRRGIKPIPGNWDWVDEWVVTDKYTVTLECNRIYIDWMQWIAQGIEIAPHELYEAGVDDWHNHVGIGTGPFLLSDNIPASSIIFVRNPDYRGTTIIDGKEYPIPFVDKFVWPIIPDAATQVAALRTGKIDILQGISWAYEESLAASNPELRSWEVTEQRFFSFAPKFNIEEPRFYDKRVRKAMSMAIDRDLIYEQLYGGHATRNNFVFPISAGETLYTPMEQQPEEVQESYQYHPEKARQLLVEAGYPDGFKIEATIINYPLEIDLMSLIADYWADIGIETDIKVFDPSAFWGLELSRGFNHIFCRSIAPAASPIGLLRMYLPGWIHTVTAWDPPVMNDLMARLESSLDTDEQFAIMKEMGSYVVSELGAILFVGPNFYRYAQPWVKNYEGEIVSWRGGSYLYAVAWLDQIMKKEMGY